MGGVSSLLRLVRGMDFAQMRRTAKRTAAEAGRPAPLVLIDMLWCGARYQAGYSDYALFQMWRMNARQRGSVLTRGKNNRYVAALNPRDGWAAFHSKTSFLSAFSDDVNREWLDLTRATAAEFESFGRRAGSFMVKPAEGTCGRGVEKLCAAGVDDWAALREELLKNGQDLCEEVVAQHEVLNRLWPGSVNTVRLVTILRDEVPHVVAAYLRVGGGERPVDNFNAGGMVVPIDRASGVVSAPAVDKSGRVFEAHPGTGTAFRGFAIPLWEECLELVRRAARVEPRVRYVGWDVAVTPDGPTLVEGNHFPGHDIYGLPAHAPDGIGVLPDWEAVLPMREL